MPPLVNIDTKAKNAWRVLLAGALGLALAAGCSAPGSEPPVAATNQPAATPAVIVTTVPAEAVTPVVPPELSFESLGNATFQGLLEGGPVTLAGGRYEGEPFVAGGAARPVVTLLPEPAAYGDLDGDGQVDAAVVLASDMGGSGTYLYLAVVQSLEGEPVNTATALLGDRVRARSLDIEGDHLNVALLIHGPDDPACCPTLESLQSFGLEGDRLVEVD